MITFLSSRMNIYTGWLLLKKTIISQEELALVVCEGSFLSCDIYEIALLMCLLFLDDGVFFCSTVVLDNKIRRFQCEIIRLLRYPCGFFILYI
jgi:hypothetical protein